MIYNEADNEDEEEEDKTDSTDGNDFQRAICSTSRDAPTGLGVASARPRHSR